MLRSRPFLVGKWTATGQYRDPEGRYNDFEVLWIGQVLPAQVDSCERRRGDTGRCRNHRAVRPGRRHAGKCTRRSTAITFTYSLYADGTAV